MFGGGGGPSTEEVIQEEFEKQREFIEEQFVKQEAFLKKHLTQTELESVKAKALGVLDALQSRFEFIAPYEGLGQCLKEEAITEITQRVEYFMDQSDAESVKHTFDAFCPEVLTKGEAIDSQQVCGFLLYTYLVIEEKRHEMLTMMMNLLADTENYEELNYGYMNVQVHQKKALQSWMMTTVGKTETYCGLFVYHQGMWEGETNKMEDIRNKLYYFAPELKDKKSDCIKVGKFFG